jgi:putative oxidoreductase
VLDNWFAPGARFAPVLLRVVVGVVGVVHGWPKMKALGSFIENVAKMGIPAAPVFGTAAALAEFLGGVALIFGLFTRYAAFFFACVMAVAVFKVHWKNGFLASGSGYEYPLVLLVAAVSLVLSGAGPISLDRMFGRKK